MAYMGDEASTRNGVQVLLSPGHQPDPSIQPPQEFQDEIHNIYGSTIKKKLMQKREKNVKRLYN